MERLSFVGRWRKEKVMDGISEKAILTPVKALSTFFIP